MSNSSIVFSTGAKFGFAAVGGGLLWGFKSWVEWRIPSHVYLRHIVKALQDLKKYDRGSELHEGKIRDVEMMWSLLRSKSSDFKTRTQLS